MDTQPISHQVVHMSGGREFSRFQLFSYIKATATTKRTLFFLCYLKIQYFCIPIKWNYSFSHSTQTVCCRWQKENMKKRTIRWEYFVKINPSHTYASKIGIHMESNYTFWVCIAHSHLFRRECIWCRSFLFSMVPIFLDAMHDSTRYCKTDLFVSALWCIYPLHSTAKRHFASFCSYIYFSCSLLASSSTLFCTVFYLFFAF